MQEIQNPYPNFHAARIKQPDLFVRIIVLQTLPNGIMIYGGPLKSDPSGSGKPQAYRFPKTKFTVSEAKKWLKDHNISFISFEEASKSDYQLDIFNQEKTPVIYLYGGVGNDEKIDGDLIAQQIRSFEQQGATQIIERINSGGGSVINGLSIVSANLNSKCEIHTYNDGIAASMAGIIWMTGDKVFMSDYAQLMIHEPSIGGETIETIQNEKTKRGLIAICDSLSKIIQNRTGKSKEETDRIMNDTTWYNAKQAARAGFLKTENIIIFSKRPKIKDNASIEEILESVTNFYKQNNNKMNDEIKAALGIADDNEILTEITLLKYKETQLATATTLLNTANTDLTKVRGQYDEKVLKVTELENSLTEKTNKVTELEVSLRTKEDKIINIILDHAIEFGKIKSAEKQAWKDQFKDDSDKLIFALEKTIQKSPRITDIINDGGHIPNDRENWGFKEWSKKDPKGLEEIKNSDLTRFNELGWKSYGDNWTEVK